MDEQQIYKIGARLLDQKTARGRLVIFLAALAGHVALSAIAYGFVVLYTMNFAGCANPPRPDTCNYAVGDALPTVITLAIGVSIVGTLAWGIPLLVFHKRAWIAALIMSGLVVVAVIGCVIATNVAIGS